MRIDIYAVGRLKRGPDADLFARYLDRARATGKAAGISAISVQEIVESGARSAAQRKSEEGEALSKALADSDRVVVLDETGSALTTLEFAGEIRAAADAGIRHFAYVIGGADGLAPDLVRRADRIVAFGALTWPHQIVRILLAEQLYRTMTIFTKHPYHRA